LLYRLRQTGFDFLIIGMSFFCKWNHLDR
jgi:hypothetical protein